MNFWHRCGLVGALAVLCLYMTVSAWAVSPWIPEKHKTGKWLEVDRLENEHKYEAASKVIDDILQAAREKNQVKEWTDALVSQAVFRMALHGYETAVRDLKKASWPKDPIARSVLNLFYASSLRNYYSSYAWEIRQRERVAATGEVDLKKWTVGEIAEEIHRSYEAAWKFRDELGKHPVDYLVRFIEKDNYPDKVRSTLRDAITYLWVELLSDTSLWRPEHANQVYRLNFQELLAGKGGSLKNIELPNPTVHPILKAVAILIDLEQWHIRQNNREGELEAFLARLKLIYSQFNKDKERLAVRNYLEKRLPSFRKVPWWSMGMATLAGFAASEETDDSLIRARQIAMKGYEGYSSSVGGKTCFSIVKGIEAPEYRLSSMSTDGVKKRSILVEHKNISRLYFRAYGLDLESHLSQSKDYSLLYNSDEMKALLGKTADGTWEVDLPSTPDFKEHKTYVVPPIARRGYYVILSSAKKDFKETIENRVIGINFILSDLVLLSRDLGSLIWETTVLSGETGDPVSGAKVALWQFNYRGGHKAKITQSTDEHGLTRFEGGPWKRNSYFVVVKKGNDTTLDTDSISFYDSTSDEGLRERHMVYTDRSVYRPGQKIFWKVVAFSGRQSEGKFHVLNRAKVRVALVDGNYKEVASSQVTTNEYGSGAGEFIIPAGRALGEWQIKTNKDDTASIRVEEYKRPTFEVQFETPKSPMRLNQKAEVTGLAKHYFGLPVTAAKVRWTVKRETFFPGWWCYEGRRYGCRGGAFHGSQSQIVAQGTSTVDEEGRFRVAFVPEADPEVSKEEKNLNYSYEVVADVTDEGGETRSESWSFRLGWVDVQAYMAFQGDFVEENQSEKVNITRSSLNGLPLSGKGRWRLIQIVQPDRTLAPADMKTDDIQSRYATSGDRLSPRWNASYDWRRVIHGWKDGTQMAGGDLEHNKEGLASIQLPKLGAGVYRLKYETRDSFGESYEDSKDFLVGGPSLKLNLPFLFLVKEQSLKVGGKLKAIVHSGFEGQHIRFELLRGNKKSFEKFIRSGKDSALVEIPVTDEYRGGFSISAVGLRDHQLFSQNLSLYVPWDNKELKLTFETFRDKIRPGSKETWKIKVVDASGKSDHLVKATELLAYMYDRSLDAFASYGHPSPLSYYPQFSTYYSYRSSLGSESGQWFYGYTLSDVPSAPSLHPAMLKFLSGYGIGGGGFRNYRAKSFQARGALKKDMLVADEAADAGPPMGSKEMKLSAPSESKAEEPRQTEAPSRPNEKTTADSVRQDFSETAFWRPQLLLEKGGVASLTFTVPDSVTSWSVFAHAVTKDFKGGTLSGVTASVKELMVRPYLPRFFREGDRAELKVVVNNASDRTVAGALSFDIFDPQDEKKSLNTLFGLPKSGFDAKFEAKKNASTSISVPVQVPSKISIVAVKVKASAKDFSDGEIRQLPILPGRMHLLQSRFVTLRNKAKKVLEFADMNKGDDPSLIHDQLAVTIDAQLFYSVLSALPYLVNYPYECTEQIMNRFLSTGIIGSVFRDNTAIAKMAKKLSTKRKTQFEKWNGDDPNRKMKLEETPWLLTAEGGYDPGYDLVNALDPVIVEKSRDQALEKLQKAQTSLGAFPWYPGGPPSPYMTLLIMYGFSKAAEFKVDVPKDMVIRGWNYLVSYVHESPWEDQPIEFLTFLNYVASNYPDPSWMGNALSEAERIKLLDLCFKHWKKLSPQLKFLLSLTLHRRKEPKKAELVFESVMDSAKTTDELGTYWAPEDRAWLWYNDTIETQAFALRTVTELKPKDKRRDGLVQWLLLNKKLNHWKSTRATAEVIYSLVHYLKAEGALGIREDATVVVGPIKKKFVFEPDEYTGKNNQIVLSGSEIQPKTMSKIVVEKESKGFAFASATWHFSTEKLPAEERGDLFHVSRKYFKREPKGGEFVLKPLTSGTKLSVGDEIEIQLSISAKHAAEYIHLRDPRPAGFEPGVALSQWKWDLGIVRYEEIRDSAHNFFIEWIPAGEYTLKYRLKANVAGDFRVGPAVLQSMYAPEFAAYSTGEKIGISQ